MSAPIFVDFEGSYTLFSGSLSGNVYRYDNIDNNLEGVFNLVDDHYGDNVRVGEESRITMTDIDGDQVLDLMLGNFRGGLNFYQTNLNADGTVDTQDLSEADKPEFNLVPNPATDFVELQFDTANGELFEVEIFDLLGRNTYRRSFIGTNLRIETDNYISGIYFCKISLDGKTTVKKLVIN